MNYVHVRNLEKFHPGYKDRQLHWAKIHFSIIQGDPDLELVESEIDRFRFVAMICLELEAKKPLPDTDKYWSSKGFNIKKRPMSLTLQMLQPFLTIVTDDDETPLRNRNTDKIREDEEKRERPTRNEVPKSLDEALLYAGEIGLSAREAEKFFDHFESNGWRVGGRAPMKDWRAALRGWQKRAGEFGGVHKNTPRETKPEGIRMTTCGICGERFPKSRELEHQCPPPDEKPTEDQVDAALAKLKSELKPTL